ncbi:hypothetical protein BU17DRAFT_51636 [Hysterangium stoloniferum]|nr:hypothetical protein BU17DRAFT_51636 [Hysterangium stoloniferum]
MFTFNPCTKGGWGVVEGHSDHKPIVLPQVDPLDFTRLLALLYLRTESDAYTSTWKYSEWSSILRLGHKYQMDTVVALAKRKLDEIDAFPSPVVQIEYGRRYDCPAWVRAGYIELITRAVPPLSVAEGEALGMADILRCAQAREEYHIR